MNKQELAAMIAEILGTMEAESLAKGGDYRPQPERTKTGYRDFAGKNGMVEVRAKCRGKDEYLTRPDLGRCFDEESKEKIRAAVPGTPKIHRGGGRPFLRRHHRLRRRGGSGGAWAAGGIDTGLRGKLL